jgi:hypothetical protein
MSDRCRGKILVFPFEDDDEQRKAKSIVRLPSHSFLRGEPARQATASATCRGSGRPARARHPHTRATARPAGRGGQCANSGAGPRCRRLWAPGLDHAPPFSLPIPRPPGGHHPPRDEGLGKGWCHPKARGQAARTYCNAKLPSARLACSSTDFFLFLALFAKDFHK